jgi:Rrf2 family protein
MYISQAFGYALHGLTSLCRKPEGELIYAADIAHTIGASESYLAKVMQLLVRSGLVTSMRGMNGGYALARPAREITLREVMEAVEDSVPHGSCILQNHSEVGRNCSACPVLAALARAHRQALEELDAITIEELARAVVPEETSALGERSRSAPEPAHQPVGS